MTSRRPAGRRLPTESGWLNRSFAILVTAGLILPIAMIAVMSFDSDQFLNFPPAGFTAHWYTQLFDEAVWTRAFQQSAVVALFAVVIATGLATAAALGVRDVRYRKLMEAAFLLPLIVPVIVTAFMLYTLYAELHWLGTTMGLIVAHSLIAFPYAFLVVAGAVHAVDPRYEQAASSLGATPWQCTMRVTIPLLGPAIVGAALVVAVVSFDEVVASQFLSSPETRTVPVVMWSFLRDGVTPSVAVASTLILAANCVAMAVATIVSGRLIRRRTR